MTPFRFGLCYVCEARDGVSTTPEMIGSYEVIRPLAQGGMAEVYEVRDPASGERMALKLLIETRSSIKRFNREFEALTRLNHPSIVRVYRYGFHARQPWITMELLDGEPLQAHIKRSGEPGEPARTDEVVRIGWLLANALQYVHDRGLVHRDLKSANVQVLQDGRAKIIDFGTAHLAHPLERITQEGDFVGTFSYAAPEQIVGSPVDHRADLYSLGVLLYRLATGRRPFKAGDPQKVAQMHLRQVARPVRELVPELPEELERIIQWLMEKKKKDRPQSAEEVARALEDMAGHPMALPGQGISLIMERPIGRERELRTLWRWFLSQSEGSLAVVAGGDVAERHRVAATLGNDAARRTWRGLVVSPSDQPVRSLLAVVRSLLQGVPRPLAEQAAQWLMEVRALQPSALTPTLSGMREGLQAALRDIDKRMLLVLEGFDRWDAQSVYAAQTLADIFVAASAPVAIVVTVSDARHPSVVALQRVMSATTTVELPPLDVRGTALAVGELLHRRPPPLEAARRVHAESHGIPTLIASVVRRMVDQGELVVRSDDGNRIEWSPRGAQTTAPGPELSAQLDDQLGRLPVALRRILEVLAVAGGAASVRAVAHAVGWEENALLRSVLELAERGLVRHDRREQLLTALDPLLLDVIDRATPPARRRVVQQLIVDALPADRGGPALVRVLVAMGRNEAALRAGIRTGTELLDGGAPADALDLLELVRPLANHPGLDPLTRAELHLLYGRCVRAVRPLDPAGMRALHTADGLVSDLAIKARVQLGYAEVQGAIGHQANYRKHLSQAWEIVMQRPESALSAETALLLAQNRTQDGDLGQANLWLERARAHALKAGAKDIAAKAEIAVAAIEITRGDLAAAEQRLATVLDNSSVDEVIRWEALAARAHILRREGRFSEAISSMERAVTAARDGRAPRVLLRLLLALAAVELDLYRLGGAQEYVEEVLQGLAHGERLQLRLTSRLLQGRIQLASGQLGLAHVQLQQVVEQADLGGLALLGEEARGYLAETRWALGMRREAMDLYRKAVVRLVEIGDLATLSDVIISRSRCVGGLEDPEKGFKLVSQLLDRPQFRALYLEYLLSEQRWHAAKENPEGAKRALQEAQTVLNSIAARQSLVEQAAMRVHPWMQEIKRGMG